MSKPQRDWCLTLNNPDAWMGPEEWKGLKYAVWQLEMGENTHTVHYQMFLSFRDPVRRAYIMSLDGLERASKVKPRIATKEQCFAYHTKLDTRLEGPWFWPDEAKVRKWISSGPGARTDLEALAEMVKSGFTDSDIAHEAPVHILKHQKGIDHLRLAHFGSTQRMVDRIDSVCYIGPKGCGKSHRLRTECPPGPEWYWASPGKWWDGYQGQPGIVFDEIRDNWYPYSYFLKLVDGGPFMVEKKGGQVQMMAWRFRFSTNVKPRNWYKNRPVKLAWEIDPLRRRFPVIRLMNVPYIHQDPIVEIDEAADWDDGEDGANAIQRAQYGQRMDD